ncbi:MAG: hypothetical protein RR555_07570, partial [Bacteroidales bacterium]
MKNIYLFLITPLFILCVVFLFMHTDDGVNVILPIGTFLLFILNMAFIIQNYYLQAARKRVSFGKNPLSNLYMVSSLIIFAISICIEFIKDIDVKWNGIGFPVFMGVCFFLVSYILYNDYLISFRRKMIIVTDKCNINKIYYRDISEIVVNESKIIIKKADNAVLGIEIQLSRDDAYMLTSFLIIKNVKVSDNYCNNV